MIINKHTTSLSILLSLVSYSFANLCDVAGGIILNDVQLNVPSEYLSINDALYCLSDKVIADGAIATIKVEDGVYNETEAISIAHSNGDHINIIGNTSSPSSVTLNFSDSNGISVAGGKSLALLNGFTIVGDDSEGNSGIFLTGNSNLNCGNAITIKDFWIGIYANLNSSIVCDNTHIKSCILNGLYAQNNSTIIARNSVVENSGGGGVVALYMSYIEFVGGTTNNNINGIYSSLNSLVSALNSTVTNNSGIGIYAGGGSNVWTSTGVIYTNNGVNTHILDDLSHIF